MVVDTDVVSFFYKNDTRAQVYEKHLDGQELYISFVSVAELYRWPFERNWGQRRTQSLREYLLKYTVLPYEDALAWTWAELVGKTCRAQPLALHDAWIAATALHYKLPLVTHNRRHFEHVPDLAILSES